MTDPEALGQSTGTSYAVRLGQLERRGVQCTATLSPNRVTKFGLGSGEHVNLSAILQVNIGGSPLDVLSTISVGSVTDENGRRRQGVGYGAPTTAEASVAAAKKTFAVVRTPYSNEPPYLLELTSQELAEGTVNYDPLAPDPENPRHYAPLANQAEGLGVGVSIPISEYDTVTLQVATGIQPDTLVVAAAGSRNGFTFVAHQA